MSTWTIRTRIFTLRPPPPSTSPDPPYLISTPLYYSKIALPQPSEIHSLPHLHDAIINGLIDALQLVGTPVYKLRKINELVIEEVTAVIDHGGFRVLRREIGEDNVKDVLEMVEGLTEGEGGFVYLSVRTRGEEDGERG